MAKFERVKFDPATWEREWSTFADRHVFQSAGWISFLAEDLKAEPVLAALKEDDKILGYFTGLIIRKFGMKILGSPFRGWSTAYMGFNLRPGVSRRTAAEALPRFAFRELGCIHFEVTDMFMTEADLDGLGFSQVRHPTLEVDLTRSEEDLFNNFTKSCRWTVRKAEKNGVVIEEAADARFAEDYSSQLDEVFAKQSMMAYFGVDRVRVLMKHLQPAGNLLLLRARDPQGNCIATALFPATHEFSFYWGGASLRSGQKLYPNELLQWHAIRYWKSRGMKVYNMIGNKEFKQKFGGRETFVPMFYQSRFKLLGQLRTKAIPIAKAALKLAYRVKTLGRTKPVASETPAAPPDSEQS